MAFPFTDQTELIPPTTEDRIAIWMRCRVDPVYYAETVLGVRLWRGQRRALRAMVRKRRLNIRSCHGAGKTFLAAIVVLWFVQTHPDSKVITTAPTFRQVEKLLWTEIRRLYKRSNWPWGLGGEILNTELKLDDGWFAVGFATKDPDSFVGHHAEDLLVVFDEACGIPAAIFEAKEGLLSSEGAKFLGIGNPTDPFSPWAEELALSAADSESQSISAYQTPNFAAFDITHETIIDGEVAIAAKVNGALLPYPALVTPAWVLDKVTRWGVGSQMWLARVDGEFPTSASDQLMDLGDIEQAGANNFEMNGEPEIRFGVDVARFGDDETTIYMKRDRQLRLLLAKRGISTTATVGYIVRFVELYDPEGIRVDDVGVADDRHAGESVETIAAERERVQGSAGRRSRDRRDLRDLTRCRSRGEADVIAHPYAAEVRLMIGETGEGKERLQPVLA